MPTARKNRSERSPGRSKNNRECGQHKGSLRKNRISGGNGGRNALCSSARITGSNFLNPLFRELSPLHINSENLFNDHNEDYQDRVFLGEPKEWISALYKCLKKNPGFKDDKEWKNYPSISKLAEYLIKAVEKICPKHHDWVFFQDQETNTYSLIYYCELRKYANNYAMPLEWIKALEKENWSLYLYCMKMLISIRRASGVDVIHTRHVDMVVSDPGTFMSQEESEEEYAFFDKQVNKYNKGGEAYEFAQKIRREAFQTNAVELKKRIDEFKPGNRKETAIKKWLNQGLKFLEDPEHLKNYTPPYWLEFQEGPPIEVYDMFNFVWTYHDKVYMMAEEYLDMDYQSGIETVGPVLYTVFSNGKTATENSREKPIKQLAEFMVLGTNIYRDYYSQHFKNVHSYEDYEKTLLHILDND